MRRRLPQAAAMLVALALSALCAPSAFGATSPTTTSTTTPPSTTTTTTTTPSAPAPIDLSAGQAKVALLQLALASSEQKASALSQRYDQIAQHLTDLRNALVLAKVQLSTTERHLKSLQNLAAEQSIDAYVNSSPSPAAMTIFNGVASQPEQRVYQSTALGQTRSELGKVGLVTLALAEEQASLQGLVVATHAQERKAHALVRQAQRSTKATEASLAQATGTLKDQMIFVAIETAKADAAKGDAAGAAAAIAIAGLVGGPQAAAEATLAADSVGGIVVSGDPTATPQQAAAVMAAASQIGTPYRFGGETPKVGFDCSGLVQWSWGQAGVSIPRTAEDQWNSLTHVPLDQLQPGDLLFYFNLDNDQVVDHVVMWVGHGLYGQNTVLAAPHTGAKVEYEPLFTQGLIGAARP